MDSSPNNNMAPRSNYENSRKHLVTQNRCVAVHISKFQYTTFYHTVQSVAIRPHPIHEKNKEQPKGNTIGASANFKSP